MKTSFTLQVRLFITTRIMEQEHNCTGATDEEMETYIRIAWWLDGVVQLAMGLMGLAGNLITVPVLLSKRINK